MTGPNTPKQGLDSASESPPPADDMDLVERLRSGDRPRFLCTLFAAEGDRLALIALYNFNLELARIRDTVSDPMVGQLRMKWWYDAMDRLAAGTPPNHPVVLALDEAVRQRGLEAGALRDLVEARAADLVPVQPRDLNGLYTYVDATAGAVGRLAVTLLAKEAPPAALQAAERVSRAWALSGLLRALPVHGAKGWHYLPEDLMAAEGLTATELKKLRYGRPAPDGVRKITAEVAAAASAALAEARALSADCPPAVLPALLMARLADDNLSRLARRGFDPALTPPGAAEPGTGAMLKLWWGARRKRF